jgi:hypothetical protein
MLLILYNEFRPRCVCCPTLAHRVEQFIAHLRCLVERTTMKVDDFNERVAKFLVSWNIVNKELTQSHNIIKSQVTSKLIIIENTHIISSNKSFNVHPSINMTHQNNKVFDMTSNES